MTPIDTFRAYFEAFEETYLDNNWDRIAPYFASDITYKNAEGETLKGRTAALEYLKTSVDSLDRRFDKPEFVGAPDISASHDTISGICPPLRACPRLHRAGPLQRVHRRSTCAPDPTGFQRFQCQRV